MDVHASVFPTIEVLTDRVMNWFGFVHASDYRIRPYAMIVACDLHASGVTAEWLTVGDINDADARNGGHLTTLWSVIHV